MGHFENSNMRPASPSPIVFKSGAPVSIVCVAATFTTLTYADNGGKVQLVSSGVHGLTTSPAVGTKIYVSWAGGIGISGLYTILSIDNTLKFTIDLTYVVGLGTPTAVITNTYVPVGTITIPVLQKNSVIKINQMASIPKTPGPKVLRTILNNDTSAVVGTSISATSANSLRTNGFIKNQNATNAQISSAHVSLSGGSLESFSFSTVQTGLAQNTLSVEIKSTNANEKLTYEWGIVEVTI